MLSFTYGIVKDTNQGLTRLWFCDKIPIFMGKVEIENRGEVGLGESMIVAKNGSKEVGWLTYSHSQDTSGLKLDIWVHDRRKGIGTLLVKRFVNEVGRGTPIMGHVSNSDTRDELKRKGFFSEAKIKGEITITDRSVLDRLVIVKVLRAGGIATDRLIISFDSNETKGNPYNVLLTGRT